MSSWRRRLAGARDRGAVAVEAALIFPIMCVIAFGIIELSLALNAQQNVTSAARGAARLASTATFAATPAQCAMTTPPSICNFTLAAATDVATALGNNMSSTTKVWVYRADADGHPAGGYAGGTPANSYSQAGGPSSFNSGENFTSCDTSGGGCVQYSGWNSTTSTFGTIVGTWTLSNVVTCQSANPPCIEDAIGVYVATPHPFITGLFGTQMTLSSFSSISFEPTSGN